LSGGTQHNRQLAGIDVKAFDQGFGTCIVLGIEQLMRMTVAAQKALKPQDVAIFRAAHDYGPTGACFQQSNTPENQGTHDALAQLRFCNQESPQSVGRDDQGFNRISRVSIHERGPACQLRQFAHKSTWPVRGDSGAEAGVIVLSDVDVPR
jgi:hypothetical protein